MNEDLLTISLDKRQTQLIVAFVLTAMRSTDEDGVSDEVREVAQSIHNLMIDAAVLEGKVGLDQIPPPEDYDG